MDTKFKNTAGIGGKRESVGFGGFISITGGSRSQRMARDYCKTNHAAYAKEQATIASLNGPAEDHAEPHAIPVGDWD